MSRRDILAPPLQRLGSNRCYRVNLVHEFFGGYPGKQPAAMQDAGTSSVSSKQGYIEPDRYTEDDEDDDESLYPVEELPNAFKTMMHVAPSLYGGLIGFKGTTKRRIESETQTEIFVPRNREAGNTAENITIKGQLRGNVCAARRKINLLVLSLRKRLRPTHFLSASLISKEIKERFIEFRTKILAEKFPGIDEELFQTENCLHLTLCTCVLLDDADRAKAAKMLQDCRQFLADLKTPMDIKVSGLEIMNNNPSAARVLYASIIAPDLQQFANRISKHFVDGGLCNEVRDNVKLHMTVLNNSYRMKVTEQSSKDFDASEILKRFGDFDFGTAQCNKIQLCVIGSKSETDGEFYKVTGELNF